MNQNDAVSSLSVGSDELLFETYKPPNCNICEPDTIEPAVGFCKDCLHHLCDECFKSHRRGSKENKSHRLIGNEEMPKKPVSNELKNVKCFECRLEKPEVFCDTHGDTLLCLNCTSSTSHGKCEWTPIKQKLAEKDSFKELEVFTAKLTSVANICTYGKRQTEEINNNAVKSKNDVLLVVTEQEKLFEAHLEELKNIKDKLCAQAEKDNKRLDQIKRCNTETLFQVQKIQEDIEAISGNDYRAFLAIQVAKPIVRDLEAKTKQENMNRPEPVYQFVPNAMFKNMLENVKVAGNFTMSTSEEPRTPCPLDGSYVEYSLPRFVLLGDNLLAVIEKVHNTLQLFDSGNLQSTRSLSSYPWDLAVYRDNKIAVTHPKEQKISLYGTESCNIKDVEDLHLGSQCEGISCFEDSLFVTSTNPRGIIVVTPTLQGKHETRKIRVDDLVQPAYIDVCKDMICVTDRQASKVFLLDWNGKHLHTFQNEYMKMPLTVTFFEGHFLVLDFQSKTVQKIDPYKMKIETRHLQDLLFEDLLKDNPFKSNAFWRVFSALVLFVFKISYWP